MAPYLAGEVSVGGGLKNRKIWVWDSRLTVLQVSYANGYRYLVYRGSPSATPFVCLVLLVAAWSVGCLSRQSNRSCHGRIRCSLATNRSSTIG